MDNVRTSIPYAGLGAESATTEYRYRTEVNLLRCDLEPPPCDTCEAAKRAACAEGRACGAFAAYCRRGNKSPPSEFIMDLEDVRVPCWKAAALVDNDRSNACTPTTCTCLQAVRKIA